MAMLGHGTINGWLSPVLPLLLSEKTPLIGGPLTNDQLSWIGSIVSVGGMIGPVIYGILTSMLGCKRATFLLAIPSMIFWFLIYFGNTFEHIFIALLIAGLSGAGTLTSVVLYVAEISNDE